MPLKQRINFHSCHMTSESEIVVMGYIYASGFSLTAQQSFFNVHLCVYGDGLLSYFDRGVHVLWFQSLPIYLEIRHRAVAKTVIF